MSNMAPGLPADNHANIGLSYPEGTGYRPLAFSRKCPMADFRDILLSELRMAVALSPGLRSIAGTVEHVLRMGAPSEILRPAVVQTATRTMQRFVTRRARSGECFQDKPVNGRAATLPVTVKADSQHSC